MGGNEEKRKVSSNCGGRRNERAETESCRLTIDGDVAESGGAVVLNVGILRVEKSNENRDGSSGDELLSILVCSFRFVGQRFKVSSCSNSPPSKLKPSSI